MSVKTFFYSNPHCIFCYNIRILFLGLLLTGSSVAINGQTFDCGSEITNDIPIQGVGSCIDNLANLDPKCVKIKFHVINNASGNTENLPDEILLQLIEKVNFIFGNTKIRFSVGNNCTHRETLTNITSDAIFRQLIGDVTPGNFDPDPSLNWDQNAINIFFFQQSIFSRPYHSFRNYPVVYMGTFQTALNSSTAGHELGHALSLKHTFGGGDNGVISNSAGWECKDGSNSETTGDFITDTPADPFTQDLKPPFGTFDIPNKCFINPPNSLKDNCNDMTTAWDIPFDNVMSYYGCGDNLTPCQSVAMHNRLLEVTNLVMDCNDDLFNYPPCVDIVISQETTWVNQVINLCPNQRIIIYPPGKLTIENCTISKGNRPPPNPNCPTLVNNGNWDGIYVGNVSFPISGAISGLILYGPTPGNILTIKSNSVIEYSNNGLVTGGTYGNVLVQNSTFQHNGRIVQAFGSGSVGFYNTILNVDASIPFGTTIQKNQIHTIGSNIYLGLNTKLENLGALDKIGINSTNGKVGITGSIIKNFEYSVFKDLGGNLDVFGSKFYGAPLYNKSSSIKVRNSYFEKLVKSEGNATGTYSGNHFKGDLYLFSPQQSNLVKENYFTNCLFGLDKNNRLSDAICNRWTNDIAVDASATELPQSWGTLSIPSGNKWEGSLRPQMYSQGISITNYHKSGNNNHIFNYNLPFKGAGSDGEVNCQYLPPPSGFGNGGTTGVGEDGQPLIPEVPVDWTSLNNQYVQIITSISNLEANLANTSGQQLLALQDDIENLRVTAGQLINEAIQHLVEDGDQSLAVIWFSRAGNISNVYQAILSAIYNSQWSTAIASSVILNEDSPEVAEDKSNFIAAINYLNNLAVNETPIDNLNESQLNSLIDLCDNSFGDYTAILRTFLNIQYGIIITSPEALIQRSRKEGSIIVAEKPFEIVISPNPNNGRFTLIKSSQMQVSELSITDLNGSKVYSSNRIMDFIELPSIIGQGVYILKYKFIGDTKEYSKKLILIK